FRDRPAAQGQDAERPRRDRRDPAGGEIDRRVRDEARARSALAGGRMTIIIAGTVRVPPENIPLFRPHMQTMLSASRAEDGCITYSYAVDVADPGLVRVFEVWRDQAAIDAHFKAPHMAVWR